MRDKEQNRKYQRDWYSKHREERKAAKRRWYLNHKEKWREYSRSQSPLKKMDQRLKAKYHIGLEEFNLMKKKQNNLCMICHNLFPENPKHIHVDHDHKTGKVRGILCKACNSILGFSSENISTLESAIKYLKENI